MKAGNLIRSLSLVFLCAMCAACFSPWQGGEAAITINIAGAGRAAWPPDSETLARLVHRISLSGPTGVQNHEMPGGQTTLTVSVAAGSWAISVEAYLDGALYATASATAEVSAGKTTDVVLEMQRAGGITYGPGTPSDPALPPAEVLPLDGRWLNLAALPPANMYTDFSYTFAGNSFSFRAAGNTAEQNFIRSGTFTSTNTTITFIPASGEAWTSVSQNYTLAGDVLELSENAASGGPVWAFGSFTRQYATVRFDSTGGSGVAPQSVAQGSKAVRPADPVLSGRGFVSWYIDQALSSEYNFDTPVTEDITLYAKWLEPQAPLSITGVPAALRYGDSPFPLGTSGGSGTGGVSYTVTDGQDVISVSGNSVTVLKAGSAAITASKAGDADYAPAASLPLTITVGKANFSFSITPAPTAFTPLAGENSAAVTMSPVGLQNGDTGDTITYTAAGFTITGPVMTYDGVTAFPAGPGGISVTVTGNAGSNYNTATATIPSVTVYDGQADYLAGDTHDRRISVTQANIEAFNTYALSAAGETGHYKLTQNAVLSEPAAGEDNWRPITDFTGSFDGGAFTIENLTVYEADYSARGSNGMFFRILDGGVVKNLTLTDCDISGASAGGIAGANNGTIENCSVTGNVLGRNAGGITSENMTYGLIQNCSFTGTVTGEQTAGGLVGRNSGTSSTIKSSWSAATVVCTNSNAGGIVGYNIGEVHDCYATGDVSAADSTYGQSGGIVGENNAGKIYHCYATGIISSEVYAGGVAGYNTGFGTLGEINGSVALNPRVTTNGKGNALNNVVGAGVRRVIGEISGDVAYSNNYGRNTMTVENFYGPRTPPVNNPVDLDGGTITSANWGNQTWWTGTAGFDATIWDFTGISATSLPKLRNAAGTQNPVVP